MNESVTKPMDKRVGRDGPKRGAKPKKPSAASENTEDQPYVSGEKTSCVVG